MSFNQSFLTSGPQEYRVTPTPARPPLHADDHVEDISTGRTLRTKLMSDELFSYFETYVDYWILLAVICMGLVTNPLNIIVFSRQGFKDGVNISMTYIAVWDLLKCVAGALDRVYKPISLVSPALGASFRNTVFMYIVYTHCSSSFVSYALASYVSIERCLCVCMPFTVKSVFTPKFTVIVCTILSILTYSVHLCMYFVWDVVNTYSTEYNATIHDYTYSEFYYVHGDVVMVYFRITAILLPCLAFAILCVCSAVTVHQLRKVSRSLRSMGDGNSKEKDGGGSGFSRREKQVVKMLLVVIIIYIVNLFPRIVWFMAQLAEPEFYSHKLFHNEFRTVAMFVFILDFVNAGCNFFIFVNMSSNFRATFLEIFPCAQRCMNAKVGGLSSDKSSMATIKETISE